MKLVQVFEAGDRVKILRKVKSHARGWRNSWVSDMTRMVGKTFMVVYHNPDSKDVGVQSSENNVWGFPDFAVQLVPTSNKKSERK